MTTKRQQIETIIDQGLGRAEADLVLKNGRFLNVVTGEIAKGDIAICGALLVLIGMGCGPFGWDNRPPPGAKGKRR